MNVSIPVVTLTLAVVLLLSQLRLSVSSHLLRYSRNANGTIIYAPLPDYSDRFQLDEQAAELRETWVLTPLINLAKQFSLTVVDYKFWDFLPEPDINAVVKELLPLIVLIGVGLVTAVLLPIVGCCFCCCRNCCGRCGARLKVSEAQKQRKECGFLTGFLLVVTSAFLMVGAGSTYSVGSRVRRSGDMLEDTINSGIADVEIFFEELFDGLNQVTTNDTTYVFDVIFEDMANIGQLVSEEMFSRTDPDVQTLFSNLKMVRDNVNKLGQLMSAVNATGKSIVDDGSNLNGTLEMLIPDLNAQQTRCSGGVYPGIDCTTLPSSSNVPVIPDFSTLIPDLTSQEGTLRDAEDVDWNDVINTANNSLKSIPSTITNGSQTTINGVNNDLDLDTLLKPLNDPLNSLQNDVDELIGDLTEIGRDAADKIDFYDKYLELGTNGLYGIAGAGFLILVLCLFGLLCGILGVRRHQVPERRTKMSHCGGCCLFCSTGWSFFFGPFFFLLGSILFALGSQMTVVCRSLDDFTIFTQYLDKPGTVGDGYLISEMLYHDGNIPVTIGGILQDCKANQAIFRAMQLDNLFNITDLLDMDSQLPDLSSLEGEVTAAIPTITILSASTNSSLVEIMNQDTSLDVQDKIGELQRETDEVELAELITILNSAADQTNAQYKNLSDIYRQWAIDLTNLEQTVLSQLKADVASLPTELHSIKSSLGNIKEGISQTLTAANKIEIYVNGVGNDVIINSVSGVANQIVGHAANHLGNVKNRLDNDLARCLIVWNVYDVMNAGLCVFFLDAFNGLWASLCITAVFIIPNIILTVRMAKYFRRPVDASAYQGTYNNQAAMAQHQAVMEMNQILDKNKWEQGSLPPSAVKYSKQDESFRPRRLSMANIRRFSHAIGNRIRRK